MTVSFRSNSSPMAGKVVPKPGAKTPSNPKTPLAGKVVPKPGTKTPKPNTTTPMAGKVIKKSPVKKGLIIAGILAFVALIASLFKSNKNSKESNSNFSKKA